MIPGKKQKLSGAAILGEHHGEVPNRAFTPRAVTLTSIKSRELIQAEFCLPTLPNLYS